LIKSVLALSIVRSVGVLLFAYSLALPLFCASDPFTGTWKLNTAKSKLQPTAPESYTVRIEADGKNLRIEQEGVDDKGAPFKLTIQGETDESLYTISGFPRADAISFRRPGPRRILAELKKSGTTVAWLDAEVAGNSLKVSLSVVDADGKEVKSQAVLQRE